MDNPPTKRGDDDSPAQSKTHVYKNMGINLITACHKHKVKVFHYRNEEDKTMMPFYYKHRDCLRKDPTVSVETLEDQTQEQDWMAEPDYGGYETDEEIQKLAREEEVLVQQS